MKNLVYVFVLFFPLWLNGQWSALAEFSFDPFKSLTDDYGTDYDEEQSVIKEINLGINYKISKFLTARVGLSKVDKRNASSEPFFQDYFIAGSIPGFTNLTLRHSSGLRNYSVYGGLQMDITRFHIAGHLHRTYSVFKDEAISAREYTTFTGEVTEAFFDIDYKNISFFKADVHFSYDLLQAERGTISITLKYIKDFSENSIFTVKDYKPELREMVENFPGSSYQDIDEFLLGGPLYYDREFWGVGVRMTYNLGEIGAQGDLKASL